MKYSSKTITKQPLSLDGMPLDWPNKQVATSLVAGYTKLVTARQDRLYLQTRINKLVEDWIFSKQSECAVMIRCKQPAGQMYQQLKAMTYLLCSP